MRTPFRPFLMTVLLSACQAGLSGNSPSGPDDAGGTGGNGGSPGVPSVPPPRRDAASQPTTPPTPPPPTPMDAGDAAGPVAPPMEEPLPAEEPDDSPATQSNPDAFTKARLIAKGGGFSDVAVDPVKRIVHLVYVDGSTVFYRRGTLQGTFQEPEVIVTAPMVAFNYARILLDKDGNAHVIYADLVDAFYHGKNNYYTNKIGGQWKMPLKVFDMAEDGVPWANAPTFAIDDDLTVFMGTAVNEPVPTKIARLESVAETPKIALKKDLRFPALNLAMSKGRLMAVGHARIHTMDKATLALTGSGVGFGDGLNFEQVRIAVDHEEILHVAFANGAGPLRGYYNSLPRLEANQGSIRYASTNRHHSGNGRVVRDRKAADRVYVFHWSGATSGNGVYPRCMTENRVHFARMEAGKKAAEERPITDRPGGHGATFRMQVAAAPHPDGGAIVVFNECTPPASLDALWTDVSLWFTRVGAYGN